MTDMVGTFGNNNVVETQCLRLQCIVSLRKLCGSLRTLCRSLRYKKCKNQGGWVSTIYTTHPPLFFTLFIMGYCTIRDAERGNYCSK